MKKALGMWMKIAMAITLTAVIILSLAFCTVKTPFDVEGKKQDFFAFSLEELEKFVDVGEYKNFDVVLFINFSPFLYFNFFQNNFFYTNR